MTAKELVREGHIIYNNNLYTVKCAGCGKMSPWSATTPEEALDDATRNWFPHIANSKPLFLLDDETGIPYCVTL